MNFGFIYKEPTCSIHTRLSWFNGTCEGKGSTDAQTTSTVSLATILLDGSIMQLLPLLGLLP
jgi:hypothetical protein